MTIWNIAPDTLGNELISSGFSSAAMFVNKRRFDAKDIPQQATGRYAWPQAQLASTLEEIWQSCKEPNWDGHNALPVTQDSYFLAHAIIRSLTASIPTPELSVEPDGQIVLEWYRSPTRLISVSIDPKGSLHYAATWDGGSQFGSKPFLGRFPSELVDVAYQVMCR